MQTTLHTVKPLDNTCFREGEIHVGSREVVILEKLKPNGGGGVLLCVMILNYLDKVDIHRTEKDSKT